MNKDIGVYRISCRANGKVYIGSSVRLSKRIRAHRSDLRQGKHPNQRLQRAWSKYGEDKFDFDVILNCDERSVFFYEQMLIDESDSCRVGFNIAACAENSRLGARLSDTQKAKMSESLRGRKLSDEHKKNISAGSIGNRHSDETRMKMRAAHTSRGDEYRANLSKALTGLAKSADHRAMTGAATRRRCEDPAFRAKLSAAQIASHTEESLAKIAERNRAMMQNPEIRAKISATLTGRKASPETRAKQSAMRKGRKISEEQKVLLSQRAKERWARWRAEKE